MTSYAHKPLRIDSEKSIYWALASLGSFGLFFKGVQLFDLVNRETHRAHRMGINTTGISIGGNISGSVGSSGYTKFEIPAGVNFFDFNGTRMTVREINLGLYSWTGVSFWGMTVNIADGGLSTPGLGVSGGEAKILFSDGRPIANPDFILKPPVHLPPGPKEIKETRPDDVLVARIHGEVLFAYNQYRLVPGLQTEKALHEIGHFMNWVPGIEFCVVGHTDSTGSRAYNRTLSKQRAETVAQWLIANNYAKPDIIRTEGAGESEPIASNATKEGRALNRRVEIYEVNVNKIKSMALP